MTGRLKLRQLEWTVPSLPEPNSLVFILRPDQADEEESHLLGCKTMKSLCKCLDIEGRRTNSQVRPQKTVKEKSDLSLEPTLLAPLSSQDPTISIPIDQAPAHSALILSPRCPGVPTCDSPPGPPRPSQVTPTASSWPFCFNSPSSENHFTMSSCPQGLARQLASCFL